MKRSDNSKVDGNNGNSFHCKILEGKRLQYSDFIPKSFQLYETEIELQLTDLFVAMSE